MNLLPLRLADPVTYGSRRGAAIDLIVLHVTESDTLEGTAAWFEHGAHASAHYIVGPTGDVCPCVPEEQAAWHAGNKAFNLRSVGIEIVGHTAALKMPTEQFLALAELVQDIRRRHPNISIDKQHIMGHHDVPDPFHPSLFGGADHHTDPGPDFDYTLLFAQLVPDIIV